MRWKAGRRTMLKVFLVEDETIIREGLRDIIPWQQYGYILVGDAGDGGAGASDDPRDEAGCADHRY